jgi:hypothetical protein
MRRLIGWELLSLVMWPVILLPLAIPWAPWRIFWCVFIALAGLRRAWVKFTTPGWPAHPQRRQR